MRSRSERHAAARFGVLAAACAAGLLTACSDRSGAARAPSELEREAVRLAQRVANETEVLMPEQAPLLTAVRSDRDGVAWLREALNGELEHEVREPAAIPLPGNDAFGRPVVAVVDTAAFGRDAFQQLLAGGGRELERRVPLTDRREGALEVLVLRSITGGPLPATARVDLFASLTASRALSYAPGDGGGRAWFATEDDARSVRAGESASWHVIYEADDPGVAVGGGIYLQSSPFWEWSPAQTLDPSRPGYTTVTTEAEGVELRARTLERGLLHVEVAGRGLRAGERVHLHYGAGPAGAQADVYAERAERLWIAVDGDGDGFRKVLADSPRIDVLPREPAVLIVRWPSIARPGETVRVTAAVLDARFNTGVRAVGELAFDAWPDALGSQPRVRFEAADEGRAAFRVTLPSEGLHRIAARFVPADGAARELAATSNPLAVDAHGPRIRWGDLHGHTNLSDGTGLPEDYFVYARDVAGLDVAALTDHDDWGLRPLDAAPDQWRVIRDGVAAAHRPNEFVALLGFEWTSWLYGHRHVLYFGDEGEIFSSLDPRYDTPAELWGALRPLNALTVPHHPAGGPIPIDWSVAPDAELEPIVEIASSHGASEAADAPRAIYSSVRGHFVRDALERGYRFGLIGSGDSHDGHPGLSWEAPHYPSGGLVALLTEDLTRAGVRTALAQRRVYATNGPRIVLRCSVGGRPMGSEISVAELASGPDGRNSAELFVHAIGTAPLERVDIVRSGARVESIDAEGREQLVGSLTLEDLVADEFVYVRVVQRDDGAAWSTPVYVTR